MELQGRLDQLKRQGLGLVAVSYDPVPILADFTARRGITFPLLSDQGSAVIKQYGILNTTVAAPGTHFSVVLDVAPASGVHVYAPGVNGYKPIALTMRPQPGLLVRDVRFPQAQDYFFKPLNEHVAVFDKPFRIQQDLEIDPAPQAVAALASQTAMPLSGTLAYQACDDKICFNPESVELTWTIGLRALDRERVKQPQ